MNPAERAQFDQGNEEIADTLSTLTRAYYQRFKDNGFTEEQAFTLARDAFTVSLTAFTRHALDQIK